MKLSIDWLKDFVDINNISSEQLAYELTMSGSKVETIEKPYKNISKVIVGQILDISKHPNADKLVVCNVKINQNEVIQIVTGATNLKPLDLIPVALNGSTLFDGKKIKKGKLRDVESNGMLCSLAELGLSKNDFPYAVEDGIFVLEENCNIGDDIKDVLGLNDTILEFEITSNRPDCLSVIGLAREASATLDKPLNIPYTLKKDFNTNLSEFIELNIENSEECKNYIATYIKNVKIKPSPKWMRNRLRANGIKPINNIVDITNYVMLEYGNPLHAFDYDKITDKKIYVRSARPNEKIIALNDKEYLLNSKELIIADSKNPIAIAGIIGGYESSVSNKTINIILESAFFNSYTIRKNSKNLNIRTDSSSRFEKDISIELCKIAMQRACMLIEELGAGEIVCSNIDLDNNQQFLNQIPLNALLINNFLGTDISENKIIEILNKLDFKIKDNIINVPHFRKDIVNIFDIAEEVARIYGYNNIPSTQLSGSGNAILNFTQRFENNIKDILISAGCYEIYTYSFISNKDYDKINLPNNHKLRDCIKIINPLGEDTSIMRTTTITSMLEALSYNFNNRNLNVSLFEIGTIYNKMQNSNLANENKELTIGMYGDDIDFFYIKGIVETLFSNLGIIDYDIISQKENPTFHPGRTAIITKNDIYIATIGEIHPIVAENYNICSKTYLANINLSALVQFYNNEKLYSPIPKYPACSRDLSLICDIDLPIINIDKVIRKSINNNLEDIKLIDIYQGEQIQKDKKSVCYSITMRNKEYTLTDKEVDKFISKTLDNLKDINVYLRT